MRLPERYLAALLLGPERLELRQLPLSEPGPGEMLVEVRAATTCGTDVKVYRRGGHPRMLEVPTPFGHEVAGVVAAVGEGVERWRPGQRVVVVNSACCGACPDCRRGRENLCRDLRYLNGAFAQFLTVPARFVERSTYSIPDRLADEAAALTEPLACVLHGLDLCSPLPPTEVLVLGAGAIGLLFVGVLAAAAHRVFVVDPHDERLRVAERLGAVATARPRDVAGLPEFELTVDATGRVGGWQQAIRKARPGGQVLLFGGCAPGSSVPLDTERLHYHELTLRGAYHHRPATVGRALESLARSRFPAELLLTSRRPLVEIEAALHSMIHRRDLKVVLRPR